MGANSRCCARSNNRAAQHLRKGLARREAAFLAAEFGPAYAAYAARTPMFLPGPRLYRTEPEVLVSSGELGRNLRDAFVFLSAIPLAELSESIVSHYDLLPLVLP